MLDAWDVLEGFFALIGFLTVAFVIIDHFWPPKP